jgi:hypothetical protein
MEDFLAWIVLAVTAGIAIGLFLGRQIEKGWERRRKAAEAAELYPFDKELAEVERLRGICGDAWADMELGKLKRMRGVPE